MFRALFFKAMERFRAQGSLGRKKGKFKLKNKLLSLDSSHHHPVPEPVPLGRVQAGPKAGSRLTLFWATTTTRPALSCSPRPR
ncbi:hypothetical protein DFAR_530011 [Desulfarculales bacterium]